MKTLRGSSLSVVLSGALLALAGTALAAESPAGQPVTIGTSYRIDSALLKQQRPLHVYLPPSYAEGKQRYPVLYLLDGGVQQDFLHVAGVASLAADYRNIREFIVVGIETLDRYHELVHPSEVGLERERLPTAGGSQKFRAFLASELLPFVQQQFRVTDESVLMGESAAGLFVMETFLQQPDLFQGYVAISPSLWWNQQSLAATAPGFSKRADYRNKRLYLSIADEGGTMQDGMNQLVNALKAEAPAGLQWQYRPMPQENHGTIYHPAVLDAVRTLFAIQPAH
ncbi:MAG TPA: alpha/beta hydrolase-fold protein [Permianibacter sp.]|nr:alpha/beta hydrolase-fold protein [Permianibacter sp.]